MRKAVFSVIGFGFLFSCGGGGAPGSDDFSTVYLTTSIDKAVINVDVVNLKKDNNFCKTEIPMDLAEQQNVTFRVSVKPNLPQSVKPSDIVIYNLNVKLFPAVTNQEPFQTCFKTVATPTATYSISAGTAQTVSITVINQEVKDCLIKYYGNYDSNICDRVTFDFGSTYSVYATLSYTAREVYTGKEKTFEINLGTFNLSDFATGGQQ